jgi:transposase
MRCQFDGLAARVRQQMGQDPLSGDGFVFINRRRTLMKVLYFEPGGFCLWSKRLEQGQFTALPGAHKGSLALSRTAFEALLEGLDFTVKKTRKRWIPGAQSGPLG